MSSTNRSTSTSLQLPPAFFLEKLSYTQGDFGQFLSANSDASVTILITGSCLVARVLGVFAVTAFELENNPSRVTVAITLVLISAQRVVSFL